MMKRLLLGLFALCFLNLSANAATCTWQGGTASWDGVNTASWSCGHVPISTDTVVFDATSGGGTVTLNFGGTITVQSITMGAFTGTFDNSVNNNNITVSNTGNAFNGSGTGTRTIKLGTATYTLSSTGASVWQFAVVTNLTLQASSSSIVFANSGTTSRTFNGGNKSYGTITLGSASNAGYFTINDGNTIGTLNITAPNYIQFQSGATQTITNALTWTGSSSSQIGISATVVNSAASLATTAGSTATWTAFRDVSFTVASMTSPNSFNLGDVQNAGITPPIASGSAACILGGWLLWRDLPEHINDNFPAWLEKVV